MRRKTMVVVAMAMVATAFAQQPGHDRILAVPAPEGIAIDGDLEDWDLSAAVQTSFEEALRPRFTIRFALMYDGQALYVGAHFADDTPLLNRHDPQVEPNRGWDADCLQVRLCSDPDADYPLPSSNSDRICHLTMWYYTPDQLPVLHAQYGMDYQGTALWTGAESGLAFREDPDGNGYTLEARIPWQRLNAPPEAVRPDDRIALVVQPLWSDGTGRKQVLTFNDILRKAGFSFQDTGMWGQAIFLEKGNLPPSRPQAAEQYEQEPLTAVLPLPDPKARVVSAAVFDSEDTLVRSLPIVSSDTPVHSQSLTVRWDGLDDNGNPLPAGDYTVKLLTHRGIGQKWVTSLHNAGNPPWRTDDGTGSWGGDHGPPIAAASDSERVYLGWTVSEAGWGVIALEKELTAEGKPRKLWGQRQVLEIGIVVTDLASDGEHLFVAQDGKGWGVKEGGANTAGVVMWDADSGEPVNFPFGKRALVVGEWRDEIKPEALETFPRLSVFHPKIQRKRRWERFEENDFGPQQMGLNLLGIAVSGDTLYASLYLEDKVVSFNWRNGERVAEFAVPSPSGLAIGPGGEVLVASAEGLMRIDPEAADVRKVVGDGLSAPWGVACDENGRIYITDCKDQMQVKVFDERGERIGTIGKAGGRPWVGRYDPEGLLMPSGITVDDDGKVWIAEHDNRPRRVSVWSKRGDLIAELLGPGCYAVAGAADIRNPERVNVHYTLFDVDYEKGRVRPVSTLVRPQMRGFQITPDALMGRALHPRHHGGMTYLTYAGRGGVVIYRLGDDMVARPVSAVIPGRAVPLHGFTKTDLPEGIREEFWGHTDQFAMTWADGNGDALVQEQELVIDRVDAFWELYWGAWIDEDFTIWSAGKGGVWRVPVIEWREGVPVYQEPADQEPLFEIPGDESPRIHSVLPGSDCVYLLEQRGGDARGGGAEFQAISRYGLDGTREWAYRRTWLGFGLEAPLARPGYVVGAMKFVGKADLGPTRLVAVNGYFGQFNLISSEGLWVASLCKDTRYGPAADENVIWCENFSGFLFGNPDNGKVYLIGGETDARIWEITGLESIRLNETQMTLSEDDHEAAMQVAMRRQGKPTGLEPIRLKRAAETPSIDGDLADWDLSSAIAFGAGGQRRVEAAVARSDQHLLVAFDVADESPMRNGGDDPGLLFKTGDACEVFVGTDGDAAPQRAQPAAGDLRLLFSVLKQEPVCVRYQPVVHEGERRPRTFSSPTGVEVFDHVGVIEEADVAIQREAEGYTLEAAVPLEAVNWQPQSGGIYRADLGVIFSDQGGTKNVLRARYANPDTAIVNDIPSEARLQPAKWGIMQVE